MKEEEKTEGIKQEAKKKKQTKEQIEGNKRDKIRESINLFYVVFTSILFSEI